MSDIEYSVITSDVIKSFDCTFVSHLGEYGIGPDNERFLA